MHPVTVSGPTYIHAFLSTFQGRPADRPRRASSVRPATTIAHTLGFEIDRARRAEPVRLGAIWTPALPVHLAMFSQPRRRKRRHGKDATPRAGWAVDVAPCGCIPSQDRDSEMRRKEGKENLVNMTCLSLRRAAWEKCI